MTPAVEYPFVQDDAELARLVAQGEFFAGCTERFLRRAGVAGAQQVLDFGCGTGAVTALAAKLCSSAAQIVGYDLSAPSVAFARTRLADARVRFETGPDVPHGPFDVIVGRMVLMYATDAVATLATLRDRLRPGGRIALQESDHSDYMSTEPRSDLYELWRSRIMATGRSCRVRLDTARRLPELLAATGFVEIEQLGVESRVERGPDSPVYGVLAAAAIGMEAAMHRHGVTVDRVPRDLADQLRDEANRLALAVHSSRLVGVVAHRP